MKLVRAGFEVLENIDGMALLKSVESAGRTCYKSEDKITDNSALEFAQKILRRGHESVIEHEKISVRIVCDRGVSHEIVRHRIASYSQESTRYCDYGGDDVTFIIPCWCVDLTPCCEVTSPEIYNGPNEGSFRWLCAMVDAEHAYKRLRDLGWKPEQARSVLPNSLKTEIVVTMNLREWRHFFKLRTAKAAHPQMREISVPMLAQFKALVPIIFDDINAEA